MVTFPDPPNHTFVISPEGRDSFSAGNVILDTSNPQVSGITRYGVSYSAAYDQGTGIVTINQSGTPDTLTPPFNRVDSWSIQVVYGGQTIVLFINQDIVELDEAPKYTVTKTLDPSHQS